MSFTYYVIKNENLYGKLKNDGSMIDYVYGPETSKIWWRNLWTAPNKNNLLFSSFLQKIIKNCTMHQQSEKSQKVRWKDLHNILYNISMTNAVLDKDTTPH